MSGAIGSQKAQAVAPIISITSYGQYPQRTRGPWGVVAIQSRTPAAGRSRITTGRSSAPAPEGTRQHADEPQSRVLWEQWDEPDPGIHQSTPIDSSEVIADTNSGLAGRRNLRMSSIVVTHKPVGSRPGTDRSRPATAGSRTVTAGTRTCHPSSSSSRAGPALQPAGRVVDGPLAIPLTDNGHGISHTNQGKSISIHLLMGSVRRTTGYNLCR